MIAQDQQFHKDSHYKEWLKGKYSLTLIDK